MAQPETGPLAVLSEALEAFTSREKTYDMNGGVEDNYAAIASIASLIIGKTITAREVALVLVALKLRRIAANPDYRDSYIDLVNYVAFAAALTEPGKLPRATNVS